MRGGRESVQLLQQQRQRPSSLVYIPPNPMPIQVPGRVPPPSPTGDGGFSLSDYESVDEALPAYDSDSADSSVVADGFRPGPGAYSPNPGFEAGPGVNDVLGDPKN